MFSNYNYESMQEKKRQKNKNKTKLCLFIIIILILPVISLAQRLSAVGKRMLTQRHDFLLLPPGLLLLPFIKELTER